VVTLTNKLTTVSGQVNDARAQPVRDSAVVLMPAEMLDPAVMARRVKLVVSGPDGTFTTRGTMPGRYLAGGRRSAGGGAAVLARVPAVVAAPRPGVQPA
jgi:hypothetical protein